MLQLLASPQLHGEVKQLTESFFHPSVLPETSSLYCSLVPTDQERHAQRFKPL